MVVAPPESNATRQAVIVDVSTAVADQKETAGAPGKAVASMVGPGIGTPKSTSVSSSFIVGKRHPVPPRALATSGLGQ
jgi:hypothetical protein